MDNTVVNDAFDESLNLSLNSSFDARYEEVCKITDNLTNFADFKKAFDSKIALYQSQQTHM
eukprot:Pgem_evm1s14306